MVGLGCEIALHRKARTVVEFLVTIDVNCVVSGEEKYTNGKRAALSPRGAMVRAVDGVT